MDLDNEDIARMLPERVPLKEKRGFKERIQLLQDKMLDAQLDLLNIKKLADLEFIDKLENMTKVQEKSFADAISSKDSQIKNLRKELETAGSKNAELSNTAAALRAQIAQKETELASQKNLNQKLIEQVKRAKAGN